MNVNVLFLFSKFMNHYHINEIKCNFSFTYRHDNKHTQQEVFRVRRQTVGRPTDGLMPEHGFTISLSCKSDGAQVS